MDFFRYVRVSRRFMPQKNNTPSFGDYITNIYVNRDVHFSPLPGVHKSSVV